MELSKALDYAESNDLDLVEVAPGQEVPVCKVMNYGKYKYEQSRKEKEAKKKKQATKAAHGAKLDYIKSLKHICPEGQELYYFKKGGNLECGCKGQKMEDGAKVKEAKCGSVAKFKKMKEGNVVVNGSTKQLMLNAKSKEEAEIKARKERDRKSLEDYEKGTYNNSDNPPDSKAMSKEFVKKYDRKQKKENGGTVVDKFKSAKCGSKMKKHQQGGSLNRIPFYQKGTSKGGVNLNSSIPNRPQFFIPLKVKPTNWYGSNQQQVVVFDNDNGNLYKRTRKIANNGDTFEEDITTRPYPLSSDTSYAYTSKYNGIKLGSNTIKHISPKLYQEYDSLKNTFRKIVSKPINGVPL